MGFRGSGDVIMSQILKWFLQSNDNSMTQRWYKFHRLTPISTQLLSILIFFGNFCPAAIVTSCGGQTKPKIYHSILHLLLNNGVLFYLISINTFPYMVIFPDVPGKVNIAPEKNVGRYSGMVYWQVNRSNLISPHYYMKRL